MAVVSLSLLSAVFLLIISVAPYRFCFALLLFWSFSLFHLKGIIISYHPFCLGSSSFCLAAVDFHNMGWSIAVMTCIHGRQMLTYLLILVSYWTQSCLSKENGAVVLLYGVDISSNPLSIEDLLYKQRKNKHSNSSSLHVDQLSSIKKHRPLKIN